MSTEPTADVRPVWATLPTEILPFMRKMETWFPYRSINHSSVLSTRTVSYRSITYVTSATHARLLDTDRYPTHSFRDPAPRTVHDDLSLMPAAPAAFPGRDAPGSGGLTPSSSGASGRTSMPHNKVSLTCPDCRRA